MNTDKIIAESIAKDYAPNDRQYVMMYYLNGINATSVFLFGLRE